MDTVIVVQDVMGVMVIVLVAIAVKFVLDVKVVILVVVEVLIIVVFVQIVKNVICVMIVALNVMVIVIHAMMYIVGAIGLQVVVVVAELEIENSIQIGFNYLNNIVNYKFGNQCIYSNHHKEHTHNTLYSFQYNLDRFQYSL